MSTSPANITVNVAFGSSQRPLKVDNDNDCCVEENFPLTVTGTVTVTRYACRASDG